MTNAYANALTLHELRQIDPQIQQDHFKSIFKPGSYGEIRCLLCSETIELGPDKAHADGGKANGFGSLRAFQAHLESTRHIVARRTGLKAASGSTPSATASTSAARAPRLSSSLDLTTSSSDGSEKASSSKLAKAKGRSMPDFSWDSDSDLEVLPTSSTSTSTRLKLALASPAAKRPRLSEPAASSSSISTRGEELADLNVAVRALAKQAGSISRLMLVEKRLDLKTRARRLGIDWDKQFAPLFYPAGSNTQPAPAPTMSTPNSSSIVWSRPQQLGPSSGSDRSASRPRIDFSKLTSNETASIYRSSSSSSTTSKDRVAKENRDAIEAARERHRQKKQRKLDMARGVTRENTVDPLDERMRNSLTRPSTYLGSSSTASSSSSPGPSQIPAASQGPALDPTQLEAQVRARMAQSAIGHYRANPEDAPNPELYQAWQLQQQQPPGAITQHGSQRTHGSSVPGAFPSSTPRPPSAAEYAAQLTANRLNQRSQSDSDRPQTYPGDLNLSAKAKAQLRVLQAQAGVSMASERFAAALAAATQQQRARSSMSDSVMTMLERQRQQERAGKVLPMTPKAEPQHSKAAPSQLAPVSGADGAHAAHLVSLAAMAARQYWKPGEGLVDGALDRLSVSELNKNKHEDNENDPEFRISEKDIEDWNNPARQTTHAESLTVQEAAKKLGLDTHQSILPGFKKPLCEFQLVSVAWMLDQEHSRRAGGMNGDEMGLGKTVQLLAVMSKNRSTDPEMKTNLVVVPLSLIAQWEAEIEKFVIGFKVHIYHSSNSKKAKTAEELTKYDVVITTHSTLSLEWRDPTKDDRGQGILFQPCWYRIIIDEAHQIRNRQTRVSKACIALDAVFRWVLSGTPMINSLSDYFPLLKFLRLRPYTSWAYYREKVCGIEKKNPVEAGRQANLIIDRIAIRRRKTDMIDGKPLIQLTPKEIRMAELDFADPDERAIYDCAERDAQVVICKFLQRGTLLKNMSCIFTLILRLRQICLHPTLITENGTGQFDKDGELERAKAILKPDAVNRLIRERLRIAIARDAIEDFELEEGVDEECAVCMEPVLPLSLSGEGVVTPCGHVFCRPCLTELLHVVVADDPNPDAEDAERIVKERPCPTCRALFTEANLIELEAFEPDPDFVQQCIARRPKSPAKKKQIQQQKEKRPPKQLQPIVISSSSDDEDALPDPSSLLVKHERKPDINRDVKPDIKPDTKPKIDRKGKSAKYESDSSDSDYEDSDDASFADVKPRIKSYMKAKINKRESHDIKPKVSNDWLDRKVDKKDPFRSPEKARPALGAAQGIGAVPLEDGEDNDDEAVFERQMARVGNKKILPSTKMRHVYKMLKEWKEEDPGIKTIIVSSFTSGLDILDNFLKSRNIDTVRFQGDCSQSERREAIQRLEQDPRMRVMLLSLKAGGTGLNLTAACRVISVDLAWSVSSELQAFDRVHRIGQTRPVLIERVVIKDTIEDRILNLQERKRFLSDMSLNEGQAKNGLGALKVPELLGLFRLGVNGERLQTNLQRNGVPNYEHMPGR